MSSPKTRVDLRKGEGDDIVIVVIVAVIVEVLPYYTPKVKGIHVVLLNTCIAVIVLSLFSSSSTLLCTQGERYTCGLTAHLHSSNNTIIIVFLFYPIIHPK